MATLYRETIFRETIYRETLMGKLKDLHKAWAKNKDLAKFAFSEGTKKKGMIGDILDPTLVPAYPLKFAKNLGPSLDKLDGAKPGAKDNAKYKKAAADAVIAYRSEINKSKKFLDEVDARICKLLLPVLHAIEEALKAVK